MFSMYYMWCFNLPFKPTRRKYMWTLIWSLNINCGFKSLANLSFRNIFNDRWNYSRKYVFSECVITRLDIYIYNTYNTELCNLISLKKNIYFATIDFMQWSCMKSGTKTYRNSGMYQVWHRLLWGRCTTIDRRRRQLQMTTFQSYSGACK